MSKEEMVQFFGEPISSYSRAEAIEDGVLNDVTETAKEAGFRFPVCLTAGVWEKCVEIPEGVEMQDEDGRLWDVLYMAAHAVRRAPVGADSVPFRVHVRNDNRNRIPPAVELVAMIHGGDNGEPVFTIMLPGED